MLRLRAALLFGALSCMMAHSALAQQGTAEVRGRIVDQQGGVLPGVGVVITNQDTGVFRDVVTGSDGSYFAGQLLPGTFRITAELSGFRRFERRDFVVGVGRHGVGYDVCHHGSGRHGHHWPDRSGLLHLHGHRA